MLKYKLYRFKWWLAKYITPKYPINVDFELSSVCNLKCVFCPHSEETTEFPKQFMTFEVFKECIDEISGKVPSIKLNLRGETTLHPNLGKFLAYTYGKFVDVRINTNGNYYSDSVNYALVKYCTNISFSVDAFYEDTYKSIRKGGDFKTLNYNINNIISYIKLYNPKTKLTLSYVVTDQNKDELDKFRLYWKARYPKIKLFIRPEMKRIGTTTAYLDKDDKYRSKTKVSKGWQIGNRIAIGRKNCYMPNRRLTITADGKISYCCLLWHNADLVGEVTEDFLLDVWNRGYLKNVRHNLKHNMIKLLHPMCVNCESSEAYVFKN